MLSKGLEAGTAYEILSIDIADIDVGKNIGATLQMDQANADKNIAQAKAEERRAMAVATEQEMKARAQQARAEVIQGGRGAQGTGPGPARRQHGFHGLLQARKPEGRHRHARHHLKDKPCRRAGQEGLRRGHVASLD